MPSCFSTSLRMSSAEAISSQLRRKISEAEGEEAAPSVANKNPSLPRPQSATNQATRVFAKYSLNACCSLRRTPRCAGACRSRHLGTEDSFVSATAPFGGSSTKVPELGKDG